MVITRSLQVLVTFGGQTLKEVATNWHYSWDWSLVSRLERGQFKWLLGVWSTLSHIDGRHCRRPALIRNFMNDENIDSKILPPHSNRLRRSAEERHMLSCLAASPSLSLGNLRALSGPRLKRYSYRVREPSVTPGWCYRASTRL